MWHCFCNFNGNTIHKIRHHKFLKSHGLDIVMARAYHMWAHKNSFPAGQHVFLSIQFNFNCFRYIYSSIFETYFMIINLVDIILLLCDLMYFKLLDADFKCSLNENLMTIVAFKCCPISETPLRSPCLIWLRAVFEFGSTGSRKNRYGPK